MRVRSESVYLNWLAYDRGFPHTAISISLHMTNRGARPFPVAKPDSRTLFSLVPYPESTSRLDHVSQTVCMSHLSACPRTSSYNLFLVSVARSLTAVVTDSSGNEGCGARRPLGTGGSCCHSTLSSIPALLFMHTTVPQSHCHTIRCVQVVSIGNC